MRKSDSSEEIQQKIITEDFPEVIDSGGSLFAAYDGDRLIGFSCIDGNLMGSHKQYAWLVMLHVSAKDRGKGVGRALFSLTVEAARTLGGTKMYISANSSQESQGFYRAVGCIYAQEILPELFEAEPYDVHMEYSL